MSVWKEDADTLAEIESAQRGIPLKRAVGTVFYGPFGESRGFDLGHLDAVQIEKVDELRRWCNENKKYADIDTIDGVWNFLMTLDEGTYGWNVWIQKRGHFLGIQVKPFRRYEE
jgi:hypothetical protein